MNVCKGKNIDFFLIRIKLSIAYFSRNEIRIKHRQLRDASDPFSLPNRMFLKLFRLDKRCNLDLIESLRPHMANVRRATGIPVHLKREQFKCALVLMKCEISHSIIKNFSAQKKLFQHL